MAAESHARDDAPNCGVIYARLPIAAVAGALGRPHLLEMLRQSVWRLRPPAHAIGFVA
jgi:hypothetical protein